MIKSGYITELNYDLNEAFKEIEVVKRDGVLSIESINYWQKLCSCLLEDCTDFIKLYKLNGACHSPLCLCKMTCSCGKCTYCAVQKFQDLYNKFNSLVEYHSYTDSCKEANIDHDNYVLKDKKLKYWERRYSKLYDKLMLFHYDFDKDFDQPSHEGYEGKVFVNNEIEVDAEDFKEILVFLHLFENVETIALEKEQI